MDCLKYSSHKRQYGVEIPGFPKRYLAISLLHNPDLWIDTVVMNTAIRRATMAPHFPVNSFAEIQGERDLPTWVQTLSRVGG